MCFHHPFGQACGGNPCAKPLKRQRAAVSSTRRGLLCLLRAIFVEQRIVSGQDDGCASYRMRETIAERRDLTPKWQLEIQVESSSIFPLELK